MKHSDQVVSFIETSINAAKLREGKRTEYRLKTTRGNVMEHLVLELLPPGGRATKLRRIWRVHYDHRQNGQRIRRKIKIGDTSSALSVIDARWREIKSAIDGGRDWYAEQEKQRLEEEAARQRAYVAASKAIEAKPRHRTWTNGMIMPIITKLIDQPWSVGSTGYAKFWRGAPRNDRKGLSCTGTSLNAERNLPNFAAAMA